MVTGDAGDRALVTLGALMTLSARGQGQLSRASLQVPHPHRAVVVTDASALACSILK